MQHVPGGIHKSSGRCPLRSFARSWGSGEHSSELATTGFWYIRSRFSKFADGRIFGRSTASLWEGITYPQETANSRKVCPVGLGIRQRKLSE